MSQWAEVRHLHLVEGVPKKEIARRLKLNVKTVRRAIGRSTPPVRVSPLPPSTVHPWRERITPPLCEEPPLTLTNTSLAVKDVLPGRARVQTKAFEAFRSGYPFPAEFCPPAKS